MNKDSDEDIPTKRGSSTVSREAHDLSVSYFSLNLCGLPINVRMFHFRLIILPRIQEILDGDVVSNRWAASPYLKLITHHLEAQ
jgi:hypothetical protein